jgi:nucleoid-associated protein YgaU
MGDYKKRQFQRYVILVGSIVLGFFVIAGGILYLLRSPIIISSEEPIDKEMSKEFLAVAEEKEEDTNSLIRILQEQDRIQDIKIEELVAEVGRKNSEIEKLKSNIIESPDFAVVGFEEVQEKLTKTEQEKNALLSQVEELKKGVGDVAEWQSKYQQLLTDHRKVIDELNHQQSLLLEEEEEGIALELQLAENQKTIKILQGSRNMLRESLAEMNEAYSNVQQEVVEVDIMSYSRVHLVSGGESLMDISLRYYGTENKWSDIYEANKDMIYDKNSIKTGTALVIP